MWKWIIVLILVAGAGAYWNYLRLAHSTFENYYVFRGCTTLIEKTQTAGTCKTANGATVKMVEYNGKWYLDGDLPYWCLGKICLGP